MPNESTEQESQPKNPIESASSFEELLEAIRKGKPVQGSRVETYTPEELARDIGEVRSGERPLQGLTRSGSIRSKVRELLKAEADKA